MDRLWVYMLCYNEELMLPFTLDYYSKYAERIFVYDNQSTDSSVAICSGYDKVKVISFNTRGLLNDKVFLRIKNNVWKKARRKARYVAVIDTDEIVYYKDGLDVLLDKAYKAGAAMVRQSSAYTLYSARITEPAEDFSLNPDNTSILCGPYEGKLAIFSPELKEINYSPGAHRQKPKGINLNEFEGGIGFHYSHVLGAKIMARKYEDRVSRMSRINKDRKWGSHYAAKFEDLVQQMHMATDKLSSIL
ncbi:MAG TPA: glycosyltransferase family 2 protein [Chlorobaculum sp.]|nr:glycosyltransferase family 2 protein [Chlorobaculum sp.]